MVSSWLVNGVSSQVYSRLDDLPARKVGMILGAPVYSDGRRSPVLAGRIQAAAELYHAGKIQVLIVSAADYPSEFCNEVQAMTQDLIALGVPENAILGDGKGFRTLDSILRMRDVFGYDDFITISQRAHCKRALYLAEHHGLSTIGFEARFPSGRYPDEILFSLIREPLARVKAVLDVLFNTPAKFQTER